MTWRHLLTAVSVAVLLAGCGGDDDQLSDSAGESATRDASSPPKQTDEAAPADLDNFVCDGRKGGPWRAEGVLTNSADERMVYTVTVVTVGAEDAVLGEKATSYQLDPEETTTFAWPRFYVGGAESCMPQVIRRPA
jgi:hypothetical protein